MLLLLAPALTSCGGESAPAHPDEATKQEVRSALLSHFPVALDASGDGRLLLLKAPSNRDFTLKVVDRTTGRVLAEHRSANSQLAASFRPDGKAVAFLSDRDGNQRYHVFVLDVATSTVRPVAGPWTSTSGVLQWDPTGRQLVYIGTTPRSPARYLVVANPDDRRPARLVARDLGRRAGLAWSPDGTGLATVRRAEPGVLVLAEVGRAMRRIPLVPAGEIRDLAWSPGGQTILATVRSPGTEFFRLVETTVSTGAVRSVASPAADVDAPVYLPKGDGLIYRVHADAEPRLVHCTGTGSRCRTISRGGMAGEVLAVTSDGRYAFINERGRISPPETHMVALGSTTGAPGHRVFSSRERTGSFTASERVDVPTQARERVPAYVWRAPRRPGRPVRALIRLHGGPALQADRAWDRSIQMLVRTGYDVVVPNYRGSVGYGARHEFAPGGDQARVADVMAVQKFVVDSLGVPAHRIALYGHSYGALLALKAAEQHPRSFGALVLVAMVPDSEPDASGWRTWWSQTLLRRLPVAAFQGENDAAMPPSEAREFLQRRLGPHVFEHDGGRLEVLEGEGHSFHRVESWVRLYSAVAAWGGSREPVTGSRSADQKE